MGHKPSKRRKQTIENGGLNQDENAARPAECLGRVRRVQMKYFGGQAVENDASMHKMQEDLLTIDDKIKQSCSPRRKRKQQQASIDDYESQDEQYLDQHQQFVCNDDNYASHVYVNVTPPIHYNNRSWQCRYCGEENQLAAFACYQCGEVENRF